MSEIKFENRLPASFSSLGKLQVEMENNVSIASPFGPDLSQEFTETWTHEFEHFAHDPEKTGELGYELNITLTEGGIIASWIAYYLPFGERTPQELMEMALAPDNPSDQDRKVYDVAWHQWVEMMQDERLKANYEETNEENNSQAPLVPVISVVPRKGDETDEKYRERIQFVKDFGSVIDELEDKGEIPPLSGVIEGNITDFIQDYGELITKAYEESLKTSKTYSLADDIGGVNEGGVEENSNNTNDKLINLLAPRVISFAMSSFGLPPLADLILFPEFANYSIEQLSEAYNQVVENISLPANDGGFVEDVSNPLENSESGSVIINENAKDVYVG